jgi:hypothetical protein
MQAVGWYGAAESGMIGHRQLKEASMEGQSRQGLLKRCLALVAGTIGLGAGAASAASAAGGEGTKLRFRGSEMSARVHGRLRGRPARPNDHFDVHGQLADRTGRAVGTFTATGLVVPTRFNGGTSTVEQHVFVFGDGTITGAGQRVDGAGTFAVTGGTGRYSGARGSYTAVVSPDGLGGDGTADFDLTLSS